MNSTVFTIDYHLVAHQHTDRTYVVVIDGIANADNMYRIVADDTRDKWLNDCCIWIRYLLKIDLVIRCYHQKK